LKCFFAQKGYYFLILILVKKKPKVLKTKIVVLFIPEQSGEGLVVRPMKSFAFDAGLF
jgi:hypothetical protein